MKIIESCDEISLLERKDNINTINKNINISTMYSFYLKAIALSTKQIYSFSWERSLAFGLVTRTDNCLARSTISLRFFDDTP